MKLSHQQPSWLEFLQHQFTQEPIWAQILVIAGLAALLVALMLVLAWLFRVVLARVVGLLTWRSEAMAGLTAGERKTRVHRAVTAPARLLAVVVVVALTEGLLPKGGIFGQITGNIAFSLLTIFIAYFAGRAINQLYLVPGRSFRTVGFTLDPSVVPLAQSVVWLIVILFAIIAILDRWGFNTAALLAGTGLFGLALSLAAQDYAKNIFGFFVLVTERPFAIGDWVTIGTVTGTVEHIGWRSTIIRQLDQVVVSVPNGSMTTANIANSVRRSKQFIRVTLNIGNQQRPDRVQAVMDAITARLQARHLVAAESVLVFVSKLTADAIEITAQCDVLTTVVRVFLAEQSAINLELLRVLEEMGMVDAMPSQRLIVHGLAASGPRNTREEEEAEAEGHS